MPTLFKEAEGHTVRGAIASRGRIPRGLKNRCMHRTFMRENREIPPSLVRPITRRAAQERLRPQA